MKNVPSAMYNAMVELFGEPTTVREIVIEYGGGDPFAFAGDNHSIRAKIGLTEACRREPLRFEYQLAHELVHILDWVPFGEASVLEEGAATYFQHWYLREVRGLTASESGWAWPAPNKYKAAHDLIFPQLERDPLCIHRLRLAGHELSMRNAESLRACIPSLNQDDANVLIERFEAWKYVV